MAKIIEPLLPKIYAAIDANQGATSIAREFNICRAHVYYLKRKKQKQATEQQQKAA